MAKLIKTTTFNTSFIINNIGTNNKKYYKNNNSINNANLSYHKGNPNQFYIETYGCQMNIADSEVVASILNKAGYNLTKDINQADIILLNSCSIREKAEVTLHRRIQNLNKLKKNKPLLKLGILGCMAERLKHRLLEKEKLVDIIAGPDAYRYLPDLIKDVDDIGKSVNVILSREETYADINPIRLGNNISAFVSIMRGCDNRCSFCVVPFTRGSEKSRDPHTIIEEIINLYENNYREVTLLGQNVDSYLWYGGGPKSEFKYASQETKNNAWDFAKLLDEVAKAVPNMLIRFTTSNPQDMQDNVLYTIAKHNNICNHIHLPVQSGSSRILELMKRGHTKEYYYELIDKINKIIPDCAISHDMIIGYPTETDQDHQDTLELMKYVKYYFGFMFKYSPRPGTFAYKKHKDDIPEEVKNTRLQEVIDLQRKLSLSRNKERIGLIENVLIEKESKKSQEHLSGRNQQNTTVIFPKPNNFKIGDFIKVKITNCTSATLIGKIDF